MQFLWEVGHKEVDCPENNDGCGVVPANDNNGGGNNRNGQNGSNNGRKFVTNGNNSGMKCGHCKGTDHTIDTCLKLKNEKLREALERANAALEAQQEPDHLMTAICLDEVPRWSQ